MADALVPVGKIYEGFWSDWSRSGIWVHTLTLCPTSATLLTNSLAIWVTLCSLQLWTIFRFILHQRVASIEPQALTPHLNGQRVILRNGGSALSTAYLMLDLAWNSRRSSGKRSKRAYAIAILAVTYAAIFTVAGVFSTKVIVAVQSNGESNVLLRSNYCGVWNETMYDIAVNAGFITSDEFGVYVQYNALRSQEVQMSLEYAQECYLSGAATKDKTSSNCHTLKQQALGWTVSTSSSCPYSPTICQSKQQTVKLDTGYIDSHADLGINAMPDERIRYRRTTECTILNNAFGSEGWDGSIANASSPRPLPDVAHAFYGQSLTRNTPYTYSYSNFASFYDNFTVHVTSPYQLDVEHALAPSDPAWDPSDFSPIPELLQDNSDITLIFLSYTGMYLGPVSDPWFFANRKHSFDTPLSILDDRYERETAISTMSCTEQHEFCTSRNDCTGPLGFNQVQNVNWFNNVLTSNENATFDRILRAVESSRLWSIIGYLQQTTTPVLASTKAIGGKSGAIISPALPEDQWKLELEFWHSIGMANLQRTVARWATGQTVPEPQYLLQPTSPQDVWFCRNLIVPSTTYQSFTVAIIVLIFVLGTLLILSGVFIKPIATWLRSCLNRSTVRRLWEHDDILELQRRKTRGPPRTPQMRDNKAYHTHIQVPISTRILTPPSNGSRRHIHVTSPPVFPRPMSRLPSIAHRTMIITPPARDGASVPARSYRDSWMTISLCGSDVRDPGPCPKVGSKLEVNEAIGVTPFGQASGPDGSFNRQLDHMPAGDRRFEFF